jgi:hypothetical protein
MCASSPERYGYSGETREFPIPSMISPWPRMGLCHLDYLYGVPPLVKKGKDSG